MKDGNQIRVRFAPSPTGYLHVGGLRTALYNYLFARKHRGTFVLRIEDTDRSRYVHGAVDNLIQTLRWAGLDYDEGPDKGGEFGPYVQSERLELYRQLVDTLIQKGKAYRCFCTAERLDEVRRQREKLKLPPKYDRHCLSLRDSEIEQNFARGVPHVVRLRIPDAAAIKFYDLIRNDVEFSSEVLDDQVLLKSDGYPTYHLANVVDDHFMRISHVIRGEEWLSSTPKHVLLYQFFGWDFPKFAHLPLLLNPDRSKLSKRQGDVAVEDYRANGYLREALLNFVALLGWNPGTEQEIFFLDDLIEQFSLELVNKAGAVFNVEKLNWLNFEHLRKKSDHDVLLMLREELSRSRYSAMTYSDEYLINVIQSMRERISFVKDILQKSPYFFEPPVSYDPLSVQKRWKADTPRQLEEFAAGLAADSSMMTKEKYELILQSTADRLHIGNGKLIHAIRLAVSGVGGGPGLYDILYILGKDECITRIHHAIERIK